MHPLPLPPLPPLLLGIDFTCAPSRRKPITVALGWRCGDRIQFDQQLSLITLDDYAALLQRPGPWLAGCDFPFGLPRTFVDALGLGDSTAAVIAEVHRRCPTRKDWRRLIDAIGISRPLGAADAAQRQGCNPRSGTTARIANAVRTRATCGNAATCWRCTRS